MFSIIFLSFLSAVEAKRPKTMPINPAPQSNFYLRDSPDKDPSVYLGRFIFDDPSSTVPNETTARKTECSKYITYQTIDAGNVEYDEVMNASAALAAGLKFPGMSPNIRAGVDGGYGIRASYTMTKKLVGDISDPAAFDQCCSEKAGNCGEYFVSEFVEGSGKLWRAHSQFAGMKVTGKIKQYLPTDVEAHGEYVWASTRDFPTPVYFAFKTTKVPDFCRELIDNPPESDQGMYFSGISTARPDEPNARKHAEMEARKAVVTYIATDVVSSTTIQKSYNQDGRALSQDDEFLSEQSQAIAQKVKVHRYCPVEEVSTGAAPQYISRLLMYVSNEDLETISEDIFGKEE